MRNGNASNLLTAAMALIAMTGPLRGDENMTQLQQQYASDARPLLNTYCSECHSKDRVEAEIDFASLSGWPEASRHVVTWQKVAEMLDSRQMPPDDASRPLPDADRTRLRGWVRSFLKHEARARAGDPGRVVLRRLSNAEYTYTIRDLTSVQSLDPAREFPADGAAGEGFTNTGSALVMSPALLTKYLDAAKQITRHAVLLPDGFRFSPHTTRRDWTDDTLREIRDFYRQFADPHGGDKVNLQGIVFETNEGGRLPVEKYLAATLADRQSLADGTKTIEAVARAHQLNAKYLQTLWNRLNSTAPSLVLDTIRDRWRNASTDDATALAAEIALWQKGLWRFTTVGHIGKVGGPKRWLEPVNPLVSGQELRLPITASPNETKVTVSLVASDAGDGNEHDVVVWQRPRLVAKDKPEILLAEVATRVTIIDAAGKTSPTTFGPPPAENVQPAKNPIDKASLRVQAPAVVQIQLPADAVAGRELLVTCALDPEYGQQGTVQLQAVTGKAEVQSGLLPAQATSSAAAGPWTSNSRALSFAAPILVNEGAAARQRFEAAFDDFREIFPAALCYTKIVPVDEVVTLTLYYREDDHLARLMLDDQQRRHLDRLWDELHYISQDALASVDALAQLIEFATQDADPKVFEPLRGPVNERAAAFRRRLVDTEAGHLSSLIDFADRAYRRPLTDAEQRQVHEFYDALRKQDLPHEDAFRLTLARVLIAPAFLYKVEKPGEGAAQSPVSDWELASRLSYFLWSSLPDDQLRRAAADARLHNSDELAAQTRRMLNDPRTRRLATEFACQWLHVYEFDTLDEKSERHFPEFPALREAMYEESIQFFTSLFQHNGSVLDILDADYTFLNEPLARHYGVPDVVGPQWRRVEGVKRYARGGILAQATTLAKQSGASRTSPILRGNWISEVLLGERLPRPPKGVPQLPDDEAATDTLTVRQLVERHVADAKCAVCHRRIDPLGFALENFDAIGRFRHKDLAGRPIDTHSKAMDGAEFEGLDGLRHYLLTTGRDAFVRQFCRKLLGYALGRGVQLSDEPLLDTMQAELAKNDYKVTAAILTIIHSRQFREIRDRNYPDAGEDQPH
jgi:hypothetical protein